MTRNWTPHYTLEEEYFGAKEEQFGYRVASKKYALSFLLNLTGNGNQTFLYF